MEEGFRRHRWRPVLFSRNRSFRFRTLVALSPPRSRVLSCRPCGAPHIQFLRPCLPGARSHFGSGREYPPRVE